jgi:hypothetical protein
MQGAMVLSNDQFEPDLENLVGQIGDSNNYLSFARQVRDRDAFHDRLFGRILSELCRNLDHWSVCDWRPEALSRMTRRNVDEGREKQALAPLQLSVDIGAPTECCWQPYDNAPLESLREGCTID